MMREPRGPQQPERPKGFVLHEREGQELVERRVVPLTEEVRAEQLAVDRIAQGIVRELSADRGRLREPEAALQNRLTRAFLQNKVGNPDLFMRQVKEACLKLGKQVTQDVERIFTGVVANIGGVKRLMDEHRAERSPAYARQFIGTNDRIDAADQVDLVDVRYREQEGSGAEIGRVRLVQIKNRELSESDVNTIHRAHAAFHARLAGAPEVERDAREDAAAERLASGEAYEAGMADRPPEERFAFEQGYFREFFEEYMTSPDDVALDDAVVRSWAHGIPMAILKLRFREERARDVFDAFAKSAGSSPAAVKEANKRFHELRAWAAANPPTLEELRVVGSEAPKGIMKAAAFESVVIHGSKVSSTGLGGQGSPKGLTKK